MTTPNRPIGVMLVDDDEAVVGAMERWLSSVPEIRWLGAVRELACAAAAVKSSLPDVVLLDIGLNRQEPFRLLNEMTRDHAGLRVIMFTGFLSPELVKRSLDAGAVGYVLKDNELPELFRLIVAGAKGEPAYCELALAALRRCRR